MEVVSSPWQHMETLETLLSRDVVQQKRHQPGGGGDVTS
jgi:molybdenum-dependent DNA-binding transcriptional regulator ModE